MDKALQQVQSRLIELGYNLGPAGADGYPGRFTTAAVAQFQKDKGLVIQFPGTIGTKTLSALSGSENTKSVDLPWIAEARKLLGLHEVKDAKKLDKALRLDTSEIAWCGAFVGMCIATALPSEPMISNQLGSRNWLKFGHTIGSPQIGAVAVFWRGSKDGWQGHVGFVVGHDKTHLHILGGNQSDKVSVARVAKDRLLGYRWPTSYPLPSDTLAMTTINASITTNEA
jgi:uncharacterized protein (TIGR02594 family)